MVWNVQKCKEKFFPLWGGVRGVRGWWGCSASSEDRIGVNFLSVFRFSRQKSFFFQICLECAETSRNEKKISTFWRGGGGGLKSQKVENSTFFIFFFLTPSLTKSFLTTDWPSLFRWWTTLRSTATESTTRQLYPDFQPDIQSMINYSIDSTNSLNMI